VVPEVIVSSGKTIGVLTSSGDCAGLNAVIRAVVARAVLGYGWRVLGLHQGTHGLLRRPVDFTPLDLKCADSAMARSAGTMLGTTNRGDPFAYPMPDGSRKDRSEEIIEGYRLLGLDALIGIGGDGSMAILRRLAQQGNIPLILSANSGGSSQSCEARHARFGAWCSVQPLHRTQDVHCGSRTSLLQSGLGQADIAAPTHAKRPHTLGKRAFNASAYAVAALPCGILHARPRCVQCLVFRARMEVERPACVLRRCAQRAVGASAAVSTAEYDMNAWSADFVAPGTPGH
jgi:Phosphofructokinase